MLPQLLHRSRQDDERQESELGDGEGGDDPGAETESQDVHQREYRDRRDGMPLFYLGDAVVMELGEQTSKLVVVYAVDAVTTEDIAVPRTGKR